MEKLCIQWQTLFTWVPVTADGDCSHEIKRHLLLGRKAIKNLDRIFKNRDIILMTKYSQTFGFSSSHLWMWELDHQESWALKNWCFWIVVLEKTLESPSDSKEIKPINPKGNQPWIFIRRTVDEVEAPIFWPPHVKSWLIGRLQYWEKLRAGGEADDRGWDGWMASPTQWTWVWAYTGR